MGSFKTLILGLHNRAHYLISMDDSLKTIKETKAVQNSLNFIQGIESLRALGSKRDLFLTLTRLKNGIKKQYSAQTKMTFRHLHLWLLPDIISLYLSIANSSVDVLKGRVGSSIFVPNPLKQLTNYNLLQASHQWNGQRSGRVCMHFCELGRRTTTVDHTGRPRWPTTTVDRGGSWH